MFVPYLADVSMRRWPSANWLLMGMTTIVSVALFGALEAWEETAAPAALLRALGADLSLPAAEGALRFFLLQPSHFNPIQLVGCTFLHDGIFHLLGNMLFLWVFGNAVNAKFGHGWFCAFYFAVAIFEGIVYVLFSSVPSLGASGAIMGVVGAFVVLYPRCDIRVFWMFFYRFGAGVLSAIWLVAIYVAFDIWGLIRNHAGVAYVSHVSGFAFGAGLTWLLIKGGVIASERNEENLLQVLGYQKLSAEQQESFGIRQEIGGRGNRPMVVATDARGTVTATPRPATKKRDEGRIPLD